MTRAIRRMALLCAMAVIGAGAGSAMFASSAVADIGGDGTFNGNFYNVTPYTWTLVRAQAPPASPFGVGNNCGPGTCWEANFPATIGPGQSFAYSLIPNTDQVGSVFAPGQRLGYDGWFTYQVNPLGAPPEYLTIAISQCKCSGIYGTGGVLVQAFNTVGAPTPAYDPGSQFRPNYPDTQNPQVGWTQSEYSATFQIQGSWSVNAATNPGGFSDVLNTLCSGAVDTTCTFTQVGPLTWGDGTPVITGTAAACVSGSDNQPGWHEIDYTASQSASLTVGAGLTLSTETNLFDLIKTDLSVSIEASHEWAQTQTFTRSAKVYIPPNFIANVWLAPVVGKVSGTLVISSGPATFTITNFGETRSGVTKGDLTPAFNDITQIRPMTSQELQSLCVNTTGARPRAPHKKRKAKHTRPVAPRPVAPTATSLYVGQGVAGARLGQTQAEVTTKLGQPLYTSMTANECAALDPRCNAIAGSGGTWAYRQLSVVFGADHRVSALIYSGPERSASGVGVGLSLAQARAAYPRASCTKFAFQTDCVVTGTLARRPVKTVFRFIDTGGGRFRCDHVLIYLAAGYRTKDRA
jgi:hypothetical protein